MPQSGDLSEFKDERSVAALIDALLDPTTTVREAAAGALGRLGDARALPPPCEPAQRPDIPPSAPPLPLRCEALAGILPPAKSRRLFDVALGHTRAAAFAGQAAVKALVGELKHDTSFKRRAAAEALEDVDDPRATQPLLAALNDDDPTVRVSAIHALSKDASAEVTPKLLERVL